MGIIDIAVLGLDLASRHWQDIGTSMIRFRKTHSVGSAAASSEWLDVTPGCIDWPVDQSLCLDALVASVQSFVLKNGIRAIAIDGPHAWREPEAKNRVGVGRACEFEAKCQGKTGVYGTTYPRTQLGWTKLSIGLFERLVALGATLANAPNSCPFPLLENGPWLCECFPTYTWKHNGLLALPSKDRCKRESIDIKPFAKAFHERFALPFDTKQSYSHDDLQATVCAVTAAAILGGPSQPQWLGVPAWECKSGECCHFVEGLIWSTSPGSQPV